MNAACHKLSVKLSFAVCANLPKFSKSFACSPMQQGFFITIPTLLKALPYPLFSAAWQLGRKSSRCQNPKYNPHLCGSFRQGYGAELYKYRRYKGLDRRTYIYKLLRLLPAVTFRNCHSYGNSYYS